jgi:RNA recognition motif-containing protein
MTGNSLGIAFIRLPSDMALKKAVDLNKMIWRDSELSVEATRKKTTVFIKNLSFNTTESSLG